MLLRMQLFDEVQKYLFCFVLRFRMNYFLAEVRGYELLSAYDAIR